MSKFNFFCPYCKQQLSADISMVSTQGACSKCSGKFIIPDPPVIHSQNCTPSSSIKGVCPYCRTEIESTDCARVCPTCNTPHHADCWRENRGCTVFGCTLAPPDEEKISISEPSQVIPQQQRRAPHAPVFRHRQKKNAPDAVSSLVFGIIGLFFCGILFGILAIIKSNKAKKVIQEQPEIYTGEGFATAGLVMGIIDIVLGAIFFLAVFASI